MSYLTIFPSLLSGQEQVFHLALEGKARSITIINIAILGIFFGISNIFGALTIDPSLPLDGQYAFITPLLFSIAGIFTMLAVLIGFCLIYWSAARAFGGPGGFNLIADLIGVSAIPFWFLAPLLNWVLRFDNSDSLSVGMLIPITLLFVWSFKLIRKSLIIGQGLSVGRATLSLACMWIFSISAVYVFLP